MGGGVARWTDVARRRRKTEAPAAAGPLALRAVEKLVPTERLRLIRVQMAWDEIAPGHLREVAWPAALRDAQLVLHVVDNQWLHELTYVREDLLGRIRRACPAEGIGELRLRVGAVRPAMREPPFAPSPAPVVALSDEPARETIDALQSVEDQALRQAMANARMALSRRLRR